MRPAGRAAQPPPPLVLHHPNPSEYTLQDYRPLRTPTTPSYGSTPTFNHTHDPEGPPRPSSRRLILNATLKMALVFGISTIFLASILWLALPTLEEEDRPNLRIPKSFAQLKELNTILKKYRDIFPFRIFICFVVTYLFLQAFSLPGSMYMSILGGAVWGMSIALPLVCCCVATGATLCYLISSALGPALLTLPKWKAKLDNWARKIDGQKDNMISFLIVLRISPLPPHWVLNILAPHVGISIPVFWISTALGILGVSVIHTAIGGGLDEMTSADDFHLISWRNFLGLSAVVAGALIPVGLRWWFGRRGVAAPTTEEEELGEEQEVLLGHQQDDEDEDEEDLILAVGPRVAPKPDGGDDYDDEDEYEGEDDDDDVILEQGPAGHGVLKD
ncbi:hypothetical protein FB45DRAFT_887937 [Roridomyces roridus]|uniref:VTT domain-containing protein n=1 Tax=Roridomyces roridus TaxID=1738132 RepID=A0AAD7CJC8_9AGAR|nr:hypothetical protein FB45DRAFT_887937 [Roridomyces roridus]